MCISDYTQATFICLERFLNKLADDQCSSITKGSIYHIKHVHTTFYQVGELNRNWTFNGSIYHEWYLRILHFHFVQQIQLRISKQTCFLISIYDSSSYSYDVTQSHLKIWLKRFKHIYLERVRYSDQLEGGGKEITCHGLNLIVHWWASNKWILNLLIRPTSYF